MTADHCHRTDDACTGRTCWVCEPTTSNNTQTDTGRNDA